MSGLLSRVSARYDEGGGAVLVRRAWDRALCRALPYRRYRELSARYHGWRRSYDVDEWDPPTDPFAILRVDPDAITRLTNRPWKPWAERGALLGSVRDGDWDRPGERADPHENYPEYFDDVPAYRALRERFVDGKTWEEVEYVQTSIERAERGGGRVGDASSEDVLDRFRGYDRLFDAIETGGYLSQFELSERGVERKTFLQAVKGEVAVDVGRDGELLFVDGRHRLGMAKILRVEEVPVVVLVRHREWMEERERVFTEGTAIDHPDLEFVGR